MANEKQTITVLLAAVDTPDIVSGTLVIDVGGENLSVTANDIFNEEAWEGFFNGLTPSCIVNVVINPDTGADTATIEVEYMGSQSNSDPTQDITTVITDELVNQYPLAFTQLTPGEEGTAASDDHLFTPGTEPIPPSAAYFGLDFNGYGNTGSFTLSQNISSEIVTLVGDPATDEAALDVALGILYGIASPTGITTYTGDGVTTNTFEVSFTGTEWDGIEAQNPYISSDSTTNGGISVTIFYMGGPGDMGSVSVETWNFPLPATSGTWDIAGSTVAFDVDPAISGHTVTGNPSTGLVTVTGDAPGVGVSQTYDLANLIVSGSRPSFQLHRDASTTAGTFALVVDGIGQTSPIPWNATATDISNALVSLDMDLCAVIDLSGDGTEVDPWYIQFEKYRVLTVSVSENNTGVILTPTTFEVTQEGSYTAGVLSETSHTDTSITVEWTASDAGEQELEVYTIQYSIDDFGTAENWGEGPVITGLTPSTQYWIRVVFQDSYGHEATTNTITVTTSGGDPPDPGSDPYGILMKGCC